ncbi:MAG: chemotaxis protein CheW [Steroidobacteraceae bacterium]
MRDDCTLAITSETVAEFTDTIAATSQHLGQILLNEGVVTPAQLSAGLQAQIAAADQGKSQLLGEILIQNQGLSPEALSSALQKQTKQRDKHGEDGRFIRVQADRLDHVINLLGELVIASAGASLLSRQTRNNSLIEASQQISSLVEEIRNGTLQLRMVPIGETFARFRRVVRDTSAELGKDIALEIVGAETELDKSVVERIADPLMHLVRNALDHGLETPERRLAAGKPAQGKLTLSARHESGSVLICIVDDGGGIQRDKVLARAWERGLIERGVTPPDADILKLIFQPGFSTAEKVTNLSGRGVGMDVVLRNIEALRGSIDVFSDAGAGTRIEIRLPLTLAIIDGFLVSVGHSKFIFPLDGVVEVIENHAGGTNLDVHGRCVVELRGQVLPVVSLRSLYALDTPVTTRGSVVVIQAGTQRYGVLVDQLHGQHQTVIKPLGKMLRSLRGMSGSSILGNGEVALIFDIHSLCQLAEQPPASRQSTSDTLALPTPHPTSHLMPHSSMQGLKS